LIEQFSQKEAYLRCVFGKLPHLGGSIATGRRKPDFF
jgi:hypothetical protein